MLRAKGKYHRKNRPIAFKIEKKILRNFQKHPLFKQKTR